ncbi:MAG: UDP-N-acetylmuramoyl-L-alanine--D-glutamate ligase [Wenzhouxiangella sp.]|nr:UDP-N-acetylmuramoyl-L-alanine--D-glutamate ligase [Wenzhouxiangella sp.]
MRLDAFKGLRVAILGFGREGQASHRVLQSHGLTPPPVVWTESGPRVDLPDAMVAPFDQRLAAFDVVIRSPGIRDRHPALVAYQRQGGRVINPSSIWFAERPEVPVIAVTGSKGKSTTASLVGHLLHAVDQRVAVAGNIGQPLIGLLDQPGSEGLDWVVAELSSYQLTDLVGQVRLGVITRLFPEHIDWHGDIEHYYAAKARLFELTRPHSVLVNAQDAVLMEAYGSHDNLKACHPTHAHRAGDITHNGATIGATIGRGGEAWIGTEAFALPGRHNLDNAVMALSALAELGFDAKKASSSLAAFRPLAHRLEQVHQSPQATWINDSIATTPHATRAALESLVDRDVVLIVGGHDRGGDWSVVIDHLKAHPIQAVVALPDSGEAITKTLIEAGAVAAERCVQAADMRQAISHADAWVKALDESSQAVVLLSPGAPSFGHYQDFEDRGRQFGDAVKAHCSR